MKILIIGNEDRYKKYLPDLDIAQVSRTVFCDRDTADEELLEAAPDAEPIRIDPLAKLSAKVIQKRRNLKIIQSEGVGLNGIDLEAAKKNGVFVCNCKGGMPAQTILLILALLRNIIVGDRTERAGNQILMKEQMMIQGIKELFRL